MEAIATEDLTKYYGKILALSDLTLKIDALHSVGFLGPNGAGKAFSFKLGQFSQFCKVRQIFQD